MKPETLLLMVKNAVSLLENIGLHAHKYSVTIDILCLTAACVIVWLYVVHFLVIYWY